MNDAGEPAVAGDVASEQTVPEKSSDSDTIIAAPEPMPVGDLGPDASGASTEPVLKKTPVQDAGAAPLEPAAAAQSTNAKQAEVAATDHEGGRRGHLPLADTTYVDIMRRRQALFKKRMREYLSNPGEDQIHNLRTSTRRMEATYDALPRSSKTPETRQFMSMAKSLFKKNSRLRDCDVMTSMLLKFGIQKDSAPIRDLEAKKTRGLEVALADAKKLSKLEVPETLFVTAKKAARRHRRSIRSLLGDVRAMFPVIAGDASRVEELHSMRKKIKRLRYLFEDEQPDSSIARLLEDIRPIQEVMGSIHDYDITMQYILDNPEYFSRSEALLVAMQEKRDHLYRLLVD